MNITLTTQREDIKYSPDFRTVLGTVYKESEIHLLRAAYDDAQVRGWFRWFTPSCYRKEPTHLTRIQIVTYIGELSYLFGVLLARDGLLPISEQEYLERIEADKASFMELRLRFRQFIRPTPEVEVRLACHRGTHGEPVVKRVRNLVVSPFLIEIAGGACTGESEAVILL
ncbi:MAG TPA: hypothetical protein VNL17_11550 [Verrucomicrobiae bacterium]|nr:hypothetical protein [Verrucomicrobiae bacterium]